MTNIFKFNFERYSISYLAGLHDHFNRGQLSTEAFFSQSRPP